jgi:hypothetical protein
MGPGICTCNQIFKHCDVAAPNSLCWKTLPDYLSRGNWINKLDHYFLNCTVHLPRSLLTRGLDPIPQLLNQNGERWAESYHWYAAQNTAVLQTTCVSLPDPVLLDVLMGDWICWVKDEVVVAYSSWLPKCGNKLLAKETVGRCLLRIHAAAPQRYLLKKCLNPRIKKP